jgi:hypothetical protein
VTAKDVAATGVVIAVDAGEVIAMIVAATEAVTGRILIIPDLSALQSFAEREHLVQKAPAHHKGNRNYLIFK